MDVKIDAKAYLEKIVGKRGVFDMMRKKMPWFHKDSGKPEAGRPLHYQHDGRGLTLPRPTSLCT